MKFYEFNESDYYSLIGAESEEKAIEHYREMVADYDREEITEIKREEARQKLLDICSGENQGAEAMEQFEKYSSESEPYLVLIDAILI